MFRCTQIGHVNNGPKTIGTCTIKTDINGHFPVFLISNPLDEWAQKMDKEIFICVFSQKQDGRIWKFPERDKSEFVKT